MKTKMIQLFTSYKEPRLGTDSSDELSLKPLTLHDPSRSPTGRYMTKSFVSQPKFEYTSQDVVDSFSMNEKDNYDELYSPATESVILSPDITGSSFVNLYETNIGERERIKQDIYCYGRQIFLLKWITFLALDS